MCIATITAIATTVATSIATAASAAAAIVVGGAAAGSATAAVGGAAVGGAAAGSAAAAAAAAVGGATVGGAAVGGAAATGLGATAFTIGSISVSWGALGLGALAVGGAVAGGVTSIVSGVQNVKMQEAQAKYMAEMEAENAKAVARQAEALDLQGNQERAQLHGKMLQTKGEARASYAAGGVAEGLSRQGNRLSLTRKLRIQGRTAVLGLDVWVLLEEMALRAEAAFPRDPASGRRLPTDEARALREAVGLSALAGDRRINPENPEANAYQALKSLFQSAADTLAKADK